jgi:CubicO group peptidase (beta-lactamase class C family)
MPALILLRRIPFAIALFLYTAVVMCGQTAFEPIAGDYTGKLAQIDLVLHIGQQPGGELICTIDLPDRQESQLPCGDVSSSAGQFRFAVPGFRSSFQGRIAPDGKTIAGTWTQGENSAPLTFVRVLFVPAARPSAVDGEWEGSLKSPAGSIPVEIHVKSDSAGREYISLDSPTQNLFGAAAASVQWHGDAFSFDLPTVQGYFSGNLDAGNSAIAGTWQQGGQALSLVFTRHELAQRPSAVDGDWEGVLRGKDGALRALMRIATVKSGHESVIFSSPDQETSHIEGADAILDGRSFSFGLPSLHARFAGILSADGSSIDGTWTQDKTLPLSFTRATEGTAADRPTQADPPMAPMTLAELHASLDRKLKPMVENPELAGMTGVGIAIGVYKQGQQEIFTYGVARPESLFEIGAITETFTGLILAEMTAEGKLSLDTPLRELLPPGTVARPEGPEITLLNLATFHSGLTHMLDGFHASNPENPFADFTAKELYDYLRRTGVGIKPEAGPDQGDAGFAILGEALAHRAGESYGALLSRAILEPLNLKETFLATPEAERGSLLQGRRALDKPAPSLDYGALAPAVGLKSNVRDMLAYGVAQLQPPGSLAKAIALQHELKAEADEGYRVAIAWAYEPETGNYFSYGHTDGYTACVFFNTRGQLAGVVLVNLANERWAQNIAYRIEALIEGRRAFPIRR